MNKIRVRFSADTPESHKEKTIRELVKLGWVQENKKVQLIPANNDPNQAVRDLRHFSSAGRIILMLYIP